MIALGLCGCPAAPVGAGCGPLVIKGCEMSVEEYLNHRRGAYQLADNPGTLYGEEEPEDLAVLPPYVVIDLDPEGGLGAGVQD